MAEGAGLENRYTGNGIVGSNPTLSVFWVGAGEWNGHRHGRRPLDCVVGSHRGQVAEWLKAHAWKACGGATHSRVRIPPCP